MRRPVAVVFATMVGLLAAVAVNPSTAQAAPVTVQPEFFGMHDTNVDSPLPYGAVRLWDTGTTWADLEPSRGHYKFAHLDALVTLARARHSKITLVLGSTPAWAARNPRSLSSAWLTPGSSSPPRSTDDWLDYVRKVVTRYRGRIDSYQIWNEASLPQFWHGSPTHLAKLTTITYPVIKKIDRHALVVSTPMLPRQPNWYTWSAAYLAALGERSWPVDVFAIHSYQPDDLASPGGRDLVISELKAVLLAAHAPPRQMWDTEANYTSNAFAKRKITGKKAAVWVARAYLDSLRMGVTRTYWYGWASVVGHLGITVRARTTAARSYRSVRSWLVGSTFRGCTVARAGTGVLVTTCALRRGSERLRVVWASANRHTRLSGKGTTVCRLLTGCRAWTKQTLVTTSPMLVG